MFGYLKMCNRVNVIIHVFDPPKKYAHFKCFKDPTSNNKFFKVGFWQTMFCGRIEPLSLPLQHKPCPTKCNYAHVTYTLHKTSNIIKKLCLLFIC